MTAASYTLVVPTPADFFSLSEMKDLAFAEKRGCFSESQARKGILECYQTYATKYPTKLQHCRLAKETATGKILGGCQLQLQGDPGDLSFSSDMSRISIFNFVQITAI